MTRRIEEILARQERALLLLKELLGEEFSHLTERNPRAVSQLELSIQELLRQIANERGALKRAVKSVSPIAERVRDLFASLAAPERMRLTAMLESMDRTEQACAVQAAKNQELALGLHDQSKSLLDFLHKEIQPVSTDAYSAKGRYAQPAAQASFLRGRL